MPNLPLRIFDIDLTETKNTLHRPNRRGHASIACGGGGLYGLMSAGYFADKLRHIAFARVVKHEPEHMSDCRLGGCVVQSSRFTYAR